jgi:drug/metabolite transporter (DMT)-like permease
VLSNLLDWTCWIAALAAIASYVAALLRNRPYLRPMNSLGLLLVGGALLGVPTVIGHPVPDKTLTISVSIVVLLVASVIVQIISAFRRRKPREGDAPKAPTK